MGRGDPARAGALALVPAVNVPITVFTLGNAVPYWSVRLPPGSMMVTAPLSVEGTVNEYVYVPVGV